MNKLYVHKSNINGNGLFISKSLKRGDHIAYISGPIHVFRKFTPEISKKMLNWIGIGKYSWIDTDTSIFRHINHSCDPNTALVSKRKVIAIKNIDANTEITMDYSLTEAEPGWKISCNCGSTKCRKEITEIRTLTKKVYTGYLPYIPKKFQKIYEQSKSK